MATAILPPCEERFAGRSPGSTECPDKRGTLIATVAGSSLAFAVGSIVNVALPAMQAEFGTDAAGAQWIVNAYLLPLGAFVLIGGALGDHRGRKRLFQIGLLLFGAACLACALAPSLAFLLAARAVLGIAAALIAPNSLSIIADAFGGEERGRAIGTWAAAGAIAGAVAPLAGGAIVDFAGWRWAFGAIAPIAAATWMIARRSVRESVAEGAEKAPLDWIGAGLIAGGLLLVVYGLISWPEQGLTTTVEAVLAAGLLLIAAFVVVQFRKSDKAMVPPGLFGSRSFAGISLLTFLLYAALGGLLVLLPYMLIERFEYGAIEAGAALLPFPLIMGALSRFAGGSLTARFGTRVMLTVGPMLCALGFLAFSQLNDGEINYWVDILPGLVVLATGMAICVAPLTNAVVSVVDDAYTGVASGVNNAISRIAGLIATALLGPVLASGDRIGEQAGNAALIAAGMVLMSAVIGWLMVGGDAEAPT